MLDDLDQDERDLATALDEIKLHEDAFGEQRQREVNDLKFEAGEHFNNAELSYLKTTGRPEVILDHVSGQISKVNVTGTFSPCTNGLDGPMSMRW